MNEVLDLKNLPEPEQIDDSESVEPEVYPDGPAWVSAVAWQAKHVLSPGAHRKRQMLILGLAAIGIVIAFWQSSWLTFITIALALGTWEIRDRLIQPTRVSIDAHGLNLDGRRFAHAELSSFDVQRMPDQSFELSVLTKHWHLPRLRIPLGEQDPQEVHALMSQYVVNEPHPIPHLEYWLRK